MGMEERGSTLSGDTADSVLVKLHNTDYFRRVQANHTICENLRKDLLRLGIPERVVESYFDLVVSNGDARNYVAEAVSTMINLNLSNRRPETAA